MWYETNVIYQIYPLGLCGAPSENDGVRINRISRLNGWVEHLTRLGVGAVLFNPLFESDRHGYDTRVFGHLDARLGDDGDLEALCSRLRAVGIRVILDGVFNHVGRGFWAFRDVIRQRAASPYRDWFYLNFDGDTDRHDGFWYESWEGHTELVKMNLQNPAVSDMLLEQVTDWHRRFGISGLRLDVAYMLNRDFMQRLRAHVQAMDPDFWLVGEMIHGDYKSIMNDTMCHSVTNYECAKGLVSACNSLNLFEIGHSLHRQFGDEPWALYRGACPMSFVDNHDISRAATAMKNRRQLPALYTILMTMPGVPCLYYGSEWGITGDKAKGDSDLRPDIEAPQWNDLTDLLAGLCAVRQQFPVLGRGAFRILQMTNRQLVFRRGTGADSLIIAVNIDDQPAVLHFDAGCGRAVDRISGAVHDFGGGSAIEAYGCRIWAPC